MKKFFLALFLVTLPALPALAWPACVVGVTDGDTITVEPTDGGVRVKVRLHGIDAPERKQAHGEVARNFVSSIALYKVVDVRPTPQRTDRYGRVVAIVEIPEQGILQELLLKNGLAWVHPKYCKDCGDWYAMQDTSRVRGFGVWSNQDSVPPWEWRKGNKSKEPICVN